MMLKRIAITLTLLMSLTLPALASNSILDSLDYYIGRKDYYDNLKYQRIAKLKSVANGKSSDKEKMDAYVKLGEEYTLFKSDTAVYYYNKAAVTAAQLSDSLALLSIRMKRIRPEMISGFYAEAHEEFRDIQSRRVPDSLLPDFYECGYRLFSFALNSIDEGGVHYDHYYSNTKFFRQKWIEQLPKQSTTRRLYEAEQAISDNKPVLAKRILDDLMKILKPDSNDYALACAFLAKIHRSDSNVTEYMHYLALSAISDIVCSVKENQSVFELSMLLYKGGDIDHAYRYIFASLEDAAFCNAQMRVYNVSGMLPVIESQHREEVSNHERVLMSYIFISFILLIGLAVAVSFLVKQMKKLTRTRAKLKEANMTKDEYMGQFLELCSIYMKRLDSFTKLVNRKLTSGQTDDLIKMIKSQKFNDEQHGTFYKEFDNAFLRIYTTFVDDVNALLRLEERFVIDAPNTLTTELRIYALLRLGIEDSSKIAEFLRYSVNTIYAYRNKMKNRAINRDTFEENVMKIGYID